MTPQIIALNHLVLTVSDIVVTLAFYRNVLGMRAVSFRPADGPTRHALEFGSQKINLHLKGSDFKPRAAYPSAGSADLCFLTDTPLPDWQDRLSRHGVAILDGPVRRTGAIGPILSIYLRDPDGNLIEISTLQDRNNV